ncbi:HlyD family type I secretion periplasmic adaptor subunit [Kordiimonas sp. SCSIO 12603]|uniref:HlyD family type I secretion periplasmic adaptor subunit n=1 Tax=Kordiimonas sp. SCSIO 12603 TaxID=2829596 RepID=UPI0021041ED2|nr:HlyD family type I secretion periplasmic adaptor subunit [Kordiimonas sp. SCSIO 12603]UTW60047.1 HlyD family type I secretion periplasmic adaptor subunit [Kordiimonas sp. SCSIO 12603]
MSNEIAKRPSSEVANQMNMRFETKDLRDWTEGLDTDKQPILRQAMIVFFLIFVIGGFWSATAPLGGAIAASGRVVAADKNRVIQHLEGGILQELYVREGDKIEKGQVLAKLDESLIQSQLKAAILTRATLRIQLARYRAIVNDLEKIQFPTNINPTVANHPRVLEAIVSQEEEFNAQRRIQAETLEILDTRIEGEKIQMEGTEQVFKSMQHQHALYKKELVDFRDLLAQGLIQRTRVYATERAVVELEARMQNSGLAIKDAEYNIKNLEAEKKQARLTVVTEANAELVNVQQNLSRIEAQVDRFTNMLQRTEIRSPVNGTVFRLSTTSIGAVLRPGDALMEVFPDDDKLTIEVRLKVSDINKVYIGQEIDVVFPGNRVKALTPLPGELTYISRDAIVDESAPGGAYILRASINPGEETEDFVPGNMAEVYIKTTPTTFFEILAGPVTRFGLKVFNE